MSKSEDSYNKAGFYAFLFSMVFSLAFFVYISLIHPGIDLKEVAEEAPSDAEQTLAGGEGNGQADFDPGQVDEIWVSSEQLVEHGKGVFAANCAVCHGPAGKGDGPAGKGLVPPPRNLVEGGWKQGGTSIDLYKTLANGIPGTSMASFGHLPSADRWALVHYTRSITEDKPEDDMEKLKEFAQSAD